MSKNNKQKAHAEYVFNYCYYSYSFSTHIANWTMTVDQNLALMADERLTIDCLLVQLMILYLNLNRGQKKYCGEEIFVRN